MTTGDERGLPRKGKKEKWRVLRTYQIHPAMRPAAVLAKICRERGEPLPCGPGVEVFRDDGYEVRWRRATGQTVRIVRWSTASWGFEVIVRDQQAQPLAMPISGRAIRHTKAGQMSGVGD